MHLLGIGSGAATPTDLVVPVHPAAVVGSTKADALPAASDAALSPLRFDMPEAHGRGSRRTSGRGDQQREPHDDVWNASEPETHHANVLGVREDGQVGR